MSIEPATQVNEAFQQIAFADKAGASAICREPFQRSWGFFKAVAPGSKPALPILALRIGPLQPPKQWTSK